MRYGGRQVDAAASGARRHGHGGGGKLEIGLVARLAARVVIKGKVGCRETRYPGAENLVYRVVLVADDNGIAARGERQLLGISQRPGA